MSHLKRTTRIHAPLEQVWATAHDSKHWSDWYVGISDEWDLDASKPAGEHRHLMVGTPFPLTQKVLEDHLGRARARWRARSESPPESTMVEPLCWLVMLAPEYEWTYTTKGGDTEVTVVMDYTVPSEVLEDPADRSAVERIEAECVEQTLENLRRLCEVTH